MTGAGDAHDRPLVRREAGDRRVPAWLAFRERVLDELDRIAAYTGPAALRPHWVLSPEQHIHRCPSCGCRAPHLLVVWFCADVAAVDLYCRHHRPGDARADVNGYVAGCSELMIVLALRDVIELDEAASASETRQAKIELLRAAREQRIRERLGDEWAR